MSKSGSSDSKLNKSFEIPSLPYSTPYLYIDSEKSPSRLEIDSYEQGKCLNVTYSIRLMENLYAYELVVKVTPDELTIEEKVSTGYN